MRIIIKASAADFVSLQNGVENRIAVDSETGQYIMQHGIDNALVMSGYPRRPESAALKIESVIFDTKKKYWVVFPADCGRCKKSTACAVYCQGVEYEKAN